MRMIIVPPITLTIIMPRTSIQLAFSSFVCGSFLSFVLFEAFKAAE